MEMWYTEKHTDSTGITMKVKETLFTDKSEFQELAILDTVEYGKVMLLDGLVMLTEKDEFVYHEMLTHPSLYAHPYPEKVLIIGGGDGGTLREVLKHKSVKKVVMAEIDGMVVEASKKYFPTVSSEFDNPRAEVLITDGIRYVKETTEKFDVILIDSTDPIGPAEGLFNFAFYQNCYNILTENGIITTQSETPFIDKFSKVIPEIQEAFAKLFPITKLYLASIPTYPAGLWTFSVGSKIVDPENDFQRERYIDDNLALSYYNDKLHKGAFALPNFVANLIKR